MGSNSPINLGLPLTPLIQNPELAGELQLIYNALRILQQVLDDAGVVPGTGTPISVLDVPHGGTAVSTITGLVKGNGTSPFTAVTNSAGLAAVLGDETGTGAAVFATAPLLVTPLLTGYTVATLPAGTVGMLAYVTDALGPVFLAPVVGGGAVVCPVFYNGAAWVVA